MILLFVFVLSPYRSLQMVRLHFNLFPEDHLPYFILFTLSAAVCNDLSLRFSHLPASAFISFTDQMRHEGTNGTGGAAGLDTVIDLS